MPRLAVPTLIAFVVLLGACGTNVDTGHPPARSVKVAIEDYQFPDAPTVAVGGKVIFTTVDAEPHKVNLGDRAASTEAFGSGDRATLTAPSEPGTYDLMCSLHPTMKGTLDVVAPD
jgi:plastocyanin